MVVLQVDFHTLLAWTETHGCLEGGERLECGGSLWKMVCSNVKYTQFVVNELKRAKLPVWFFSVGALISHLMSRDAVYALLCKCIIIMYSFIFIHKFKKELIIILIYFINLYFVFYDHDN